MSAPTGPTHVKCRETNYALAEALGTAHAQRDQARAERDIALADAEEQRDRAAAMEAEITAVVEERDHVQAERDQLDQDLAGATLIHARLVEEQRRMRDVVEAAEAWAEIFRRMPDNRDLDLIAAVDRYRSVLEEPTAESWEEPATSPPIEDLIAASSLGAAARKASRMATGERPVSAWDILGVALPDWRGPLSPDEADLADRHAADLDAYEQIRAVARDAVDLLLVLEEPEARGLRRRLLAATARLAPKVEVAAEPDIGSDDVPGDEPYWRLYRDRDGHDLVVCMQWFDEGDYDETRFLNDEHYPTREAAEQALREHHAAIKALPFEKIKARAKARAARLRGLAE